MFDILNAVEDYNIRELEKDYSKQGIIRDIRNNVDKTSRDFGVKEPLREDDGNIKFKDDFDDYTH